MAPPQLGDEQINCGPDWVDSKCVDGKILSFSTPLGIYDLGTIYSKLYPSQLPDVVVCLVDSTWRNMPKNLKSFKCPKILLVADTHHQQHPIIGMLQYAASEPYDRIVFLYNRHHIPFFYIAGFRNLFWLPGLTFPHSDKFIAEVRKLNNRETHIAFVGQAGSFHPRRARLLTSLLADKQPVLIKNINQADAFNYYASSLIGFNSSLNGDLNLRIFEILAAGACLITDKLSSDAGLDLLLTNNINVLMYSSLDELKEIAKNALLKTHDTAKIGLAGSLWFDLNMSEKKRRDNFISLAFDNVTNHLFDLSNNYINFYKLDSRENWFIPSIIIYELIQELHRSKELIRVAFDESVSVVIVKLFQTLPRLLIVNYDTDTCADLGIISVNNTYISTNIDKYWFWNSNASDELYLKKKMSQYILKNSILMYFCKI